MEVGSDPNQMCVVIEDEDLTDDEPGPSRSALRPAACTYEASWFNQPFQRPTEQVLNSHIPEEHLLTFQDYIWNKPDDRMVPGFGMTPKELASVSSDGRKGWLVTSHFYWLSRCLNKQQDHTRFFVLDTNIRQAALKKLFSGKISQEFEQLIFVMSVGRQDDGIVFLGTDKMPGDHWSVAVVNVRTGVLSYCDTLGWPAPQKLNSYVIKYTHFFGLSQPSQLQKRMAHESNGEQHECSACCTNYPLQTCSDVCGVIAMVCIAIAALDRDLFELLMKPVDKNLNLYLTDPTEYSSYLRHVLIYWLASGHIDISRISLKPSFDPLAPSSKEVSCLKRKLDDSSCNGDAGDKRKRTSAANQKKGVNINEYILEALETKVPSNDLVAEVVDLFAAEGGMQNFDSEKVKKDFAHLTFNNTIERSKDDAVSAKTYLKDFLEFPNNNPVILFKNPGREMKTLRADDTVVAIQTSYQREMMKTYGKTCICMDLTRKGEGDKFVLLTVLVFYEGKIELPVAWLITSRFDYQVLILFVKSLKVSVGELKTDIFLGDMGQSFYKAWTQHFPKPGKRMFCTSDVLQVWNNKLDSLIPGIKDRNEVKRYLSILPQLTDKKAFSGYMKALLDVLKPFGEFLDQFKAKYVDDARDELWASCHRHVPLFEHTPFLQPYKSTLRILGFFGRHRMNRLDVCMHRLLQLARFQESKLNIEPSQGRLQNTLRDLKRRHLLPTDNLDIYQSASGEEWYIRASSEVNAISVIESNHINSECQLRCEMCKICVHHYVCSCADYLLSAASCKHIHFIHTYKKMNSVIDDTAVTLPLPGGSNKEEEPKKELDINVLRTEAQRELDYWSQEIKNVQDAKTLQALCTTLGNCRKK